MRREKSRNTWKSSRKKKDKEAEVMNELTRREKRGNTRNSSRKEKKKKEKETEVMHELMKRE